MKKQLIFATWASLLICISVFSNFYAQEKQSYFLGSTAQFEQQLTSSVSEREAKALSLAISEHEILNATVNYNKINNGSMHLEGEIQGDHPGSFSIVIKENKLNGNILLFKDKKAYTYYSDNGKAFVKETDINNLICTDFSKSPSSYKSEKSSSRTTLADINNLQSFPGAAGCILLDFNGHYMPAGSGWNGGNPINAQPSGMTASAIEEAWEVVAEDYRPFSINVTTNESVYNSYPQNKRMRAVITTTTQYHTPGLSGVAFVNSFSNAYDNDTPCWVFTWGATMPGKFTGDVASHELGHTFGLGHDGINGGGYYAGHGNWAPIMGMSDRPVMQWSKGEYTGASNLENDLAIISGAANGVGYRADNAGGTYPTAVPLTIVGNQITPVKGVIERTGELDIFYFNTTGGNIEISVKAADRHSNLRPRIRLHGNTALPPILDYTAQSSNLGLPLTFNTNLPAGKYYIIIEGVGDGTANTGYTNYGSLGAYSIYGKTNSSLLSTKEIKENNAVKIFPNPVKDNLTIDLGSDNDTYEIELVNPVGQSLYKATTSEKTHKISVSEKPAGKYFIILKNTKTGLRKSYNIIKQ